MRITFLVFLFTILIYSCNNQDSANKMNTPSFTHNLQFEKSDTDTAMVKGFQEVVFSVSDLKWAKEFYQKATGWQIIYEGIANTQQTSYWQLPEATKIEEVVINNPNDNQGFLRLVKFNNVPQKQIRSSGRPWDSGGIFDINLRAKDLQASFIEFQEEGWNGFSDPIRYQFGKFDVSEVVMQGNDGIAIAMMQRHAPTLKGYPNLRKLSHVFNSTHISKDVDLAVDFFVNKLGFKIYMQTKGMDRKAGRNVLGIPQNVNDDIELPVYIVHPEGINFGSVEFIQMKGLDGENFADLAVPPNLGILMLRFPVSNATAYAQQLMDKGVQLHLPITEMEIAPYGKVKIFVLRSPDGVWLEFMEILSS